MEETIGDLKSALKKRLAGRRVALVGLGNTEKGDDAFGVRLVSCLKERLKDTAVFECGTTPENYLGPITKIKPQSILIIDAANLGAEPGHTHIVEEEDISALGLSTHDASLKLFIAYIKSSLEAPDIFLLGVQPRDTSLGSGMSRELKGCLARIEEIFLEILK